MKKIKLKTSSKKLKSQIKFNKDIAKRLSNTAYYQAQSKNLKSVEFLEREKARLSTPKWERITQLLEYYKNLGFSEKSSTGKILLGLFNKNKLEASKYNPKNPLGIVNGNLLSIVARTETLMLAYREIKGNKGALTQPSPMTKMIMII